MRDVYSLYEAKARLSAIVRRVQEGHRVVVTLRGEPVAEIRPITPEGDGLASRLDRLAERGVLVRGGRGHGALKPGAAKRGALARFLAERD